MANVGWSNASEAKISARSLRGGLNQAPLGLPVCLLPELGQIGQYSSNWQFDFRGSRTGFANQICLRRGPSFN